MKKVLIFFVSFICIYVYADGATVKYSTGNVTVYIKSFSYREEMNKGIIIAESVRELSKLKHYSDSINIFLEMSLETIPIYQLKGKNSIFLHTKSIKYNILDHLKLMEYAINKKGNFTENLDYNSIIKEPNSKQINDLLKIRFNRPTFIKELDNNSIYTYYYQNEKYNFYNIETNKPIMSLDSVYYMTTVAYFRPLIFVNKESFYYMNLEDSLKLISFPIGLKLSEDFRMKEIGHFVILYVYQKSIEDFNLIILDLEKNELRKIMP